MSELSDLSLREFHESFVIFLSVLNEIKSLFGYKSFVSTLKHFIDIPLILNTFFVVVLSMCLFQTITLLDFETI